ncbi:MAG: class I SAM-dependent methyltransferase [Bacteriovoracaceae bacterium]|nr:class I SAM-dependent methyltransferase [Bacteriovoracaceae bacterium]
MNKILPAYDVHPISVKMLRKGHPWIIKDKFTDKFHPRDRFIVAKDRRRPFALLIHDPRHKDVKARLWADKGDFAAMIKNFRTELSQRIQKSVLKRKQKEIIKDRENFYLIFGEADQLPGVHVQYLAGEILIQFYSYFWDSYTDYFIDQLLKTINKVMDVEVFKGNVWIQHRADGSSKQQKAKSLDPNISFRNVEVKEFGVKYKVELGKAYDCGLYTDMAAIRSSLSKDFESAKSVLNLYSYTGAFSLYALKHNTKNVVSVDLSEKYLEQLEHNISLNEELEAKNHKSMAMSTLDSLKQLAQEKKKFDLVISDPPSSSSDGNKRTNALQNYEKELPQMAKLLSENGKLLIFLNTRRVTRNKFEAKITDIIQKHNLPLKVGKKLGLADDCPFLKGFPEGSYLKGLVLVHD